MEIQEKLIKNIILKSLLGCDVVAVNKATKALYYGSFDFEKGSILLRGFDVLPKNTRKGKVWVSSDNDTQINYFNLDKYNQKFTSLSNISTRLYSGPIKIGTEFITIGRVKLYNPRSGNDRAQLLQLIHGQQKSLINAKSLRTKRVITH
jgi:hypothetical protein